MTIRNAIATPVTQTLYNVTYPGHVDNDANVPYSYLRNLAANGCAVTIVDSIYGPATVIHPIPTAWVIRDAAGEYLTTRDRWTPASDEALEYDTREEALAAAAACGRATAQVLLQEIID